MGGLRDSTAAHWALTQFTPASMAVQAHNVAERVFSIVVLLLGLVTFSSFVSSITNAMTQLRNLSTHNQNQVILLRRYLRQRNVSLELSARIIRYLKFGMVSQSQSVQANQLSYLGLLSTPLRAELEHSVQKVNLNTHPIFGMLINSEPLAHR